MSRALFVSSGRFLGGTGGVQAATREYRAVLEAAGFTVSVVAFEPDRRWSTRIGARCFSSPYWRPAEPGLVQRIAQDADRLDARVICLNQCALAPLARMLRPLLHPDSRIVLLSHGLESTDLPHTLRARRDLPLSGRFRPTGGVVLAHTHRVERTSRPYVDAVCTLSPEDAALEQRLGTVRVDWLPRLIEPAPLSWAPASDRVGLVGTLDHAPNLEGLVAVLRALPASTVRVRVVGGPPEVGRWLSATFPAVDYLGPLDDVALRQEAASWSAFLHPLFYLSRGCSTKLATGLAWQLPIVTTRLGRRGYAWREGGVVEAETPRAFVDAALRLLDPAEAARCRDRVIAASTSGPTLADNAARFRALVDPA